jgi:hypothetical protein
MLKISKMELLWWDISEWRWGGFILSVLHFEMAKLPPCAHCGSENTADVQVGVVQYTMNLAAATSKFKLIPNGPKPGKYFCNACKKFFGDASGEPSGGFTLTMRKGESVDDFKKRAIEAARKAGMVTEPESRSNRWQLALRRLKAFFSRSDNSGEPPKP